MTTINPTTPPDPEESKKGAEFLNEGVRPPTEDVKDLASHTRGMLGGALGFTASLPLLAVEKAGNVAGWTAINTLVTPTLGIANLSGRTRTGVINLFTGKKGTEISRAKNGGSLAA